jgi:hypothetical protein
MLLPNRTCVFAAPCRAAPCRAAPRRLRERARAPDERERSTCKRAARHGHARRAPQCSLAALRLPRSPTPSHPPSRAACERADRARPPSSGAAARGRARAARPRRRSDGARGAAAWQPTLRADAPASRLARGRCARLAARAPVGSSAEVRGLRVFLSTLHGLHRRDRLAGGLPATTHAARRVSSTRRCSALVLRPCTTFEQPAGRWVAAPTLAFRTGLLERWHQPFPLAAASRGRPT